jgi:hypothetical protein
MEDRFRVTYEVSWRNHKLQKSFGTRLRSSKTFQNLQKPSENMVLTLVKVFYVNKMTMQTQENTPTSFEARLRSSVTFKTLRKPSKSPKTLRKIGFFGDFINSTRRICGKRFRKNVERQKIILF